MPPQTTSSHTEPHSNLSGFIRNVIIGMADGLTVPFAIAAGLASIAANDQTIIIAAVLAEIAAGSISMGLGGFLAGKTDVETYHAERAREAWEEEHKPDVEEQEVVDVLHTYGLTEEESRGIAQSLRKRKDDWINFMMRFELGLEKPNEHDALKSAATIGGAYIVGGFIPLAPYLFVHTTTLAFELSIVVTFIALLGFGYVRGAVIGASPLRSMWQTALVGAIAAGAAFFLARLVP